MGRQCTRLFIVILRCRIFQGRLLGNCFFEGSIALAPFDQNQGSYCRTAAEYAAAAKVDLCCQLQPGISSKRAGPEANQLQECDGLEKVESAGILYGVDMAVQRQPDLHRKLRSARGASGGLGD